MIRVIDNKFKIPINKNIFSITPSDCGVLHESYLVLDKAAISSIKAFSMLLVCFTFGALK